MNKTKMINVNGFSDKAENRVVLPTVRTLFLVLALLSLISIILGIGGAAYFYIRTFKSAELLPMPTDTPLPQDAPTAHIPINSNLVINRLTPPTNVRINIEDIVGPITKGTAIGYLTADTVNGLSEARPFTIAESVDHSLFSLGKRLRDGHLPLYPTESLVKEINSDFNHPEAPPKSREYRLQVGARDQYELESSVADLVFKFSYLRKNEPQKEAAASPVSSELNDLAKDIARKVVPTPTPLYFELYDLTLKRLSSCAAGFPISTFVADVRQVFKATEATLSTGNHNAFLNAVCAEWRGARQEERAAKDAFRAQQAAVQRKNESARAAVLRENSQRRAEIASLKRRNAGLSLKALGVVGGGICALIIASLFVYIFGFIRTSITRQLKIMEDIVAVMLISQGGNTPPPPMIAPHASAQKTSGGE